jgi:hypothetical protein
MITSLVSRWSYYLYDYFIGIEVIVLSLWLLHWYQGDRIIFMITSLVSRWSYYLYDYFIGIEMIVLSLWLLHWYRGDRSIFMITSLVWRWSYYLYDYFIGIEVIVSFNIIVFSTKYKITTVYSSAINKTDLDLFSVWQFNCTVRNGLW